jgi:hypothetical protein
MGSRLTLIWANNSITTGETWAELEEAIRAEQWSTYKTRLGFRRALVRRAKVWSSVHVSVLGSSRRFINALARTEAFQVFDALAVAEHNEGEDHEPIQ